MIYRILAAAQHCSHAYVPFAGSLRGGFVAGLEGFHLPAPEFQHRRTRFYFTEKGWQEVGKAIAARARREHRMIRILRRKNPLPSQIVFEDNLQVAILPRKDVPRNRRQ